MNFKLATVALGLSLLAGAAPAGAGDYDYGAGSVKDYGGAGVPVPAPVPLPMYDADWYVRLDAGYTPISTTRTAPPASRPASAATSRRACAGT